MLSFLYVYSDHSILECYNLFSGVELSMRSFFVIKETKMWQNRDLGLDPGLNSPKCLLQEDNEEPHLHT